MSSRNQCQRIIQGKYIFKKIVDISYTLTQLFYFLRWAVYDIEWDAADGRKVSKLIFIMYSPDDNNDNSEKFVIACNKDQLKSKIPETNRDW